jgi:hypothetical protein
VIDKGTAIAGVGSDKDGVRRPQGAASDIGAYEYGGGGPPTSALQPPTNLSATAR